VALTDAECQKANITIIDIAGKKGSTSLHIPASTADPASYLADFFTALDSCISGQIVKVVSDFAANGVVGTATPDQAYDARDKLAVEIMGSQNDLHTQTYGSPLETCFLASNMEVADPSGPYGTLKTAILTNYKDKLGHPVTIKRAYRRRSRKLKTSIRFV
jgi:hypothetical protein